MEKKSYIREEDFSRATCERGKKLKSEMLSVENGGDRWEKVYRDTRIDSM